MQEDITVKNPVSVILNNCSVGIHKNNVFQNFIVTTENKSGKQSIHHSDKLILKHLSAIIDGGTLFAILGGLKNIYVSHHDDGIRKWFWENYIA